ncbi:MAG TPA: zf-HC2 domain-containing protein [Pyrinomonadaceae bacterium]|jgi:hypothetical protein
MLNNNHKNSGCDFGEALVSYLYGETDAREKAAFEAHLRLCQACAEELEAFSGVQFAINDWKLKDFAELQTPVIEIPSKSAENPSKASTPTGSWLPAFVRDLFSLTPPRGWALATASLALLAVFAGIALFALNSKNGGEIAGTNKNSKPAVVVPTVEKTLENSNDNANQSNSAVKDSKPQTEQKTPEVAVSKPESENKRVVKAVNNQRQPSKSDDKATRKNNDARRSNKTDKDVAPKVIPDDDEDDTLRLAELFEEIDTKKD